MKKKLTRYYYFINIYIVYVDHINNLFKANL